MCQKSHALWNPDSIGIVAICQTPEMYDFGLLQILIGAPSSVASDLQIIIPPDYLILIVYSTVGSIRCVENVLLNVLILPPVPRYLQELSAVHGQHGNIC